MLVLPVAALQNKSALALFLRFRGVLGNAVPLHYDYSGAVVTPQHFSVQSHQVEQTSLSLGRVWGKFRRRRAAKNASAVMFLPTAQVAAQTRPLSATPSTRLFESTDVGLVVAKRLQLLRAAGSKKQKVLGWRQVTAQAAARRLRISSFFHAATPYRRLKVLPRVPRRLRRHTMRKIGWGKKNLEKFRVRRGRVFVHFRVTSGPFTWVKKMFRRGVPFGVFSSAVSHSLRRLDLSQPISPVRAYRLNQKRKLVTTMHSLLQWFMPFSQASGYAESVWGRRSSSHVALWPVSLSSGVSRLTVGAVTRNFRSSRPNRRFSRNARARDSAKLSLKTRPKPVPSHLAAGRRYVRSLLRPKLLSRPFSFHAHCVEEYFMPNVHRQGAFVFKPFKPYTPLLRRAYLRKLYSTGGRKRDAADVAKSSATLLLKKPILTMRRWFAIQLSRRPQARPEKSQGAVEPGLYYEVAAEGTCF